ncbi:class I SAM-dependent methyltransferase [bacterium]|nr:class I SAM-dependent methyltransferase [bacterium]
MDKEKKSSALSVIVFLLIAVGIGLLIAFGVSRLGGNLDNDNNIAGSKPADVESVATVDLTKDDPAVSKPDGNNPSAAEPGGDNTAGDEREDGNGHTDIVSDSFGQGSINNAIDLRGGGRFEDHLRSRFNNIESETDKMGDFLNRAEAGELKDKDLSEDFCELWPEMRAVMVLDNLIRQNKGKEIKFKNDHQRNIYNYLFGSGEEKRKISYWQLKLALCFERLMRIGSVYFNNPSSFNSKYMHCPNTKLSYFEPESQMLRCPKSGMVYSNYEHFMIGAPRELFRQLSMGYYDEKRSHGLDAFILGSGVSAVRSGETVAEVGCGVGCYTDSLAKGAGPDGKVVAMDVDESVLKFVEYNAGQNKKSNIKTLLVERSDPRLAADSVDRIYMIDVLNVMTGINIKNNEPLNPDCIEYLKKLYAALKKGGYLVLVDFYPFEDCPHISPDKATEIMSEFKLKKVDAADVNSGMRNMYILTFKKD